MQNFQQILIGIFIANFVYQVTKYLDKYLNKQSFKI